MKKITGFAFAFFMTISLFARGLTLQDICDGLAKHPDTTGDFTQTKTINANGRTLKSSGNFIISTQGIMWKTLKPFPSTLVITETAMVQTSADGKQSVMSGSDNQIFKNISGTLSSVFAGDSAQLEKNFAVEVKSDDTNQWTVVLTPKDSTISSVMKTLELTGVSSPSGIELSSLELLEESSNKIKYEFTNQKYPEELTDEQKANFTLR